MMSFNASQAWLRSVFLTCLLILTACHRIPKISDYPIQGVMLTPAEAQKVAFEIDRRNAEVQSLRLLSRCELSYNKSHFAYRYAFVSEQQRGLRIEQLPVSGFYALATLVSAENKTTLIFPHENKAIIFSTGGAALETMLGLALPFTEDDIGPILSGSIPKRFWEGVNDYRAGSEGDKSFIKNEILFAELESNCLVKEAHFFAQEDGEERLHIHFEYDEQRLPKLFRISIPKYQVTLNCQAQSRSWNVPIPPRTFLVDIPSAYSLSDERSREAVTQVE